MFKEVGFSVKVPHRDLSEHWDITYMDEETAVDACRARAFYLAANRAYIDDDVKWVLGHEKLAIDTDTVTYTEVSFVTVYDDEIEKPPLKFLLEQGEPTKELTQDAIVLVPKEVGE